MKAETRAWWCVKNRFVWDSPICLTRHAVKHIELIERAAEFREAAEMVEGLLDNFTEQTSAESAVRNLAVKLKEMADGR